MIYETISNNCNLCLPRRSGGSAIFNLNKNILNLFILQEVKHHTNILKENIVSRNWYSLVSHCDVALARSSDRYDRFDWWRTRCWRSGLLIRHDSNPCNRYTAAPLVINQAQLDWPRQEDFFSHRIEEHKQERINAQSEIADEYEAPMNMGWFEFWSQKD
jgi:hypothetical protein